MYPKYFKQFGERLRKVFSGQRNSCMYMPERIYNPIYGNGVLPFIWTTLRGKHCQHPFAVMGVVDTFGQCKAV
jgi:hypothetical protein